MAQLQLVVSPHSSARIRTPNAFDPTSNFTEVEPWRWTRLSCSVTLGRLPEFHWQTNSGERLSTKWNCIIKYLQTYFLQGSEMLIWKEMLYRRYCFSKAPYSSKLVFQAVVLFIMHLGLLSFTLCNVIYLQLQRQMKPWYVSEIKWYNKKRKKKTCKLLV